MAALALEVEDGVHHVLEHARARDPPSFVTWPISSRLVPRRFANRISTSVEARSWLTVPGAASIPSTYTVWTESMTSTRGASALVEPGHDLAHRGGAAEVHGRAGDAEPAGAQADLVERLLAADVDDAVAGPASEAAAWSVRVDLPMPGSPPISIAAPATIPPPRTRSSSSIPVRRRGGGAVARSSSTSSSRRRRLPSATGDAPPAPGTAEGAASSVMLFQPPHELQRPAQRGWTAPQAWQTKWRWSRRAIGSEHRQGLERAWHDHFGP